MLFLPDPIVKQPSFFSLASGFPPEFSVRLSRFGLPHKRAEPVFTPKMRDRSAARRNGVVSRAPSSTRRSINRPALRRSAAASFRPWGPTLRVPASRATMREPGGIRDSNPGLRSEPGAIVQGLPGARLRHRARGRRSPLTLSIACRNVLRRAGTRVKL